MEHLSITPSSIASTKATRQVYAGAAAAYPNATAIFPRKIKIRLTQGWAEIGSMSEQDKLKQQQEINLMHIEDKVQ